MSPYPEVDKIEEPEFKWLKKRGKGGKKKDVQFYESFTYDGVEYTLYDCVYMYTDGEPYIGKLVKIWENADKSKKIKVHWFFRPSEIALYLQDVDNVLENELFLASGEGVGLANLNPLEAIAGKCNVVCVSVDSRNPQPSAEELQMADYVFYRTFDVKSCTISDQVGDSIGGLEVKFMLNVRSVNNYDLKLDSDTKCEARTSIAFREPINHSGKDLPHEIDNVKPDNFILPKKAMNAIQAQVKQKPCSPNLYLTRKLSSVDDIPSKRIKFDGDVSSLKVEDTNDTRRDVVVGRTSSDAKLKSELVESYEGPGRTPKVPENDNLGKGKLDLSKERPRSGLSKNGVRLECDAKLMEGSNDLVKKLPETNTILSSEKSKPTQSKDFGIDKHHIGGNKAKYINSDKMMVDNDDKIEKLKEKNCSSDERNLLPNVTPYDNKEMHKQGKGFIKEFGDEKVSKIFNDNLPMTTLGVGDGKAGSQMFEVIRRPIVERSNWIKLPWEERLKGAYDQGRLVVLQNLDPSYTSGEVEDIIWCAFKEQCTAKMAQHTAISNPYSGQAFVIFKTRDAAEGVLRKLNDGCLVLPNQRPLVACSGHIPNVSEKQMTFVGHLAIDKARRLLQREMVHKEKAVSTSHYSQNNTIEYEMAVEWCLQHAKSEKWWEKLYQQQRREYKRLVDDLKSKSK